MQRLAFARRLLIGVAALGVSGALAWALWPVSTVPLTPRPLASLGVGATAVPDPSAEFRVAAFSADLWHEPPEPVIQVAPKPPEMPKLELVGILGSGQGRRAIVQDNDAGELRTVSAGDGFGATTVLGIDADRLRCEAHGIAFELRLDGSAP